ncbi:hypothetical protein [Brevundimonas sp.]|uniref:hypothetical protein n=1 Tax=Brevundimonas sp. TaxID=1871086 RepID=UPI0025B833E3|nr:hypothetical protein [Brevundimonas sp.]
MDFYNLSADPDVLYLVHLDEIESIGFDRSVNVSSLRRIESKTGFYSVWEIHCDEARMGVVQAAQFGPDFSGDIADMEPEWMSPARGTMAGDLFQVACGDRSKLDPSRIIRNSSLLRQRRSFWN